MAEKCLPRYISDGLTHIASTVRLIFSMISERIYEGLDRSFFARIDGYGRGGLLLLPARREGGALSELRDTFTAFARSKLGDKDTDHGTLNRSRSVQYT